MKLKLFVASVLLLTVTTVSVPALAQPTTDTLQINNTEEIEKVNNIKELLAITGAKNLAQQVMNQMLGSIKSQYPQVPQKFWDTFLEETNVDRMIDKLVPVYSKYLTNEDVKGLIRFYQTPLGKKTLVSLPQISRDSITIGQQYGLEAAKRALQRLQKEGYLRRR